MVCSLFDIPARVMATDLEQPRNKGRDRRSVLACPVPEADLLHSPATTNGGPALMNGIHDVNASDLSSFTFFPPTTTSTYSTASPANNNIVSSGTTSGSNRSHKRRQFRRTRSLANIAIQSSTLADLVASPNSNSRDSSSTPATIPTRKRPRQALGPLVLTQSDVNPSNGSAEQDLDPFSTPPQSPLNSVMFPSLTSVIDSLLENKSSKVEMDPLGCALLPVSEYELSIESDCKFHYSFWDAFDQIQFCLPIDLCLYVNPSRVHLYEYHALAMPSVSGIAIRFTTVALQTRFPRLLPRPPQSALPLIHQNPDVPMVPPNQIYTITYRGAVIKPPNGSQKKSPQTEIAVGNGIYLSSAWERLINPSSKSKTSPLDASTSNSETDGDVGSSRLEEGKEKEKRGFTIRAWVPVPVTLFMNKETRTFNVAARVWIEDSFTHRGEGGQNIAQRPRFRQGMKWDVGYFDDEKLPSPNVGNAGERMLEASAHVTVSHLQSRREMIHDGIRYA